MKTLEQRFRKILTIGIVTEQDVSELLEELLKAVEDYTRDNEILYFTNAIKINTDNNNLGMAKEGVTFLEIAVKKFLSNLREK